MKAAALCYLQRADACAVCRLGREAKVWTPKALRLRSCSASGWLATASATGIRLGPIATRPFCASSSSADWTRQRGAARALRRHRCRAGAVPHARTCALRHGALAVRHRLARRRRHTGISRRVRGGCLRGRLEPGRCTTGSWAARGGARSCRSAGCITPRATRAAGFCVFNDCGVVIEYLRRRCGLRRIAYVDIDAHHGDGVYLRLRG